VIESREPRPTLAQAARFDDLFANVEPRLRRALMASYGFEKGREATAEALAWGWEPREHLQGIDNPVAYLFRVGQSKTRRRRFGLIPVRAEWAEPWVEPKLAGCLAQLSRNQRVAVVLIHGYSWTMSEVADLLGVKVTTVQNHADRGLDRLRRGLGVSEL